MESREKDVNFEKLDPSELSTLLRQFYAEVRTKNNAPYSRSSLIGLRAAIQRHLESPPYNVTFNIITDNVFKPANIVFSGRLKLNKIQGKDTTTHKTPIQRGDMEKLYSSNVLSNDNPVALQRKVYVEISLHFARRGREGLRDLKVSSFEILTDDQEKRYVTIKYNEKSKKDQGDQKNNVLKEQRMYEQPDDPLCPVRSFELYVSKLNAKSDIFFIQPMNKFGDLVWYDGRLHGINTLGNFMAQISKAAGLSGVYTNHCLRPTAVTVLSNTGVDSTDIISISKHKNVQRLIPYQRCIGDRKRESMRSLLGFYGKKYKPTVSLDQENRAIAPQSNLLAQSSVSSIM